MISKDSTKIYIFFVSKIINTGMSDSAASYDVIPKGYSSLCLPNIDSIPFIYYIIIIFFFFGKIFIIDEVSLRTRKKLY